MVLTFENEKKLMIKNKIKGYLVILNNYFFLLIQKYFIYQIRLFIYLLSKIKSNPNNTYFNQKKKYISINFIKFKK